MDIATLVGIIAAVTCLAVGLGQGAAEVWSVPALLIVVGGGLMAFLVSYPLQVVVRTAGVVWRAVAVPRSVREPRTRLIERIVGFAETARREGISGYSPAASSSARRWDRSSTQGEQQRAEAPGGSHRCQGSGHATRALASQQYTQSPFTHAPAGALSNGKVQSTSPVDRSNPTARSSSSDWQTAIGFSSWRSKNLIICMPAPLRAQAALPSRTRRPSVALAAQSTNLPVDPGRGIVMRSPAGVSRFQSNSPVKWSTTAMPCFHRTGIHGDPSSAMARFCGSSPSFIQRHMSEGFPGSTEHRTLPPSLTP